MTARPSTTPRDLLRRAGHLHERPHGHQDGGHNASRHLHCRLHRALVHALVHRHHDSILTRHRLHPAPRAHCRRRQRRARPCAGVCMASSITIGHERFILDLYVLPLNEYELVLGCLWLKSEDARPHPMGLSANPWHSGTTAIASSGTAPLCPRHQGLQFGLKFQDIPDISVLSKILNLPL